MLPEATQKEKILADAGEELGYGVSGYWSAWSLVGNKMWQGVGEIQRMWALAFPAHPLCCCAKDKIKLGGGGGQEISSHDEEK